MIDTRGELIQDFFGPAAAGLLNDHEEKAMSEEKALDYRSPAGQASPEKPAKFYVVYVNNRSSANLLVEQFDMQSQAEEHIVQLRTIAPDAKPVIFYGHMSKPQVKQHVTYTVEYK